MKALKGCRQNPVGPFGWSLKHEKVERNADDGSLPLELPEGSRDPTGNRSGEHPCPLLAVSRHSTQTFKV